MIFDRYNQPPCSKCGCQDSEILRLAKQGSSTLRCAHCGAKFYAELPAELAADAVPAHDSQPKSEVRLP